MRNIHTYTSGPAAIHQGKNIWMRGLGYTTCSETFATLDAAKAWLDAVYKQRPRKSLFNSLTRNRAV